MWIGDFRAVFAPTSLRRASRDGTQGGRRRANVVAILVSGSVLVLAGCAGVLTGHGSTQPVPSHSLPSASLPAHLPATSGLPLVRAHAIVSPGGDFSVVLPDGWTDNLAFARKAGALTGYVGPVTGAFATVIDVTREYVGSLNVSECARAGLAGLRASMHIWALHGPVPTTVDGEHALEYSFEIAARGDVLMQRQTVVVHNRHNYVITYTARRAYYHDSIGDADAILDSWHWG